MAASAVIYFFKDMVNLGEMRREFWVFDCSVRDLRDYEGNLGRLRSEFIHRNLRSTPDIARYCQARLFFHISGRHSW